MLPSIRRHLNFYRIHILFFTFTPLIFSAIFYASNGRYKISYIDALFNCVSAMTVCGLATLDLSSLTPWQQVILFIQMCLGSPVVVSWVMVYIRKYYFEKKFEHLIESVAASKEVPAPSVSEERSAIVRWCRLLVSLLNSRKKEQLPMTRQDSSESFGEKGRKTSKKLRTDMIRRMDDAPKLVNPSGWISEGDSIPIARFATINSHPQPFSRGQFRPSVIPPDGQPPVKGIMARRLSDPGTPSRPSSPQGHSTSLHRFDTVAPKSSKFPRTPTVEFSTTLPRRRARIEPLHEEEGLARPTELGGVEYRALNALLWIVGAYHIGIQLVSFVVIASYMSISKWNSDFLPPALHRPVSSTWFSLYQTVSAYTNTGTSLVDTSMIPFQKAYPVIVFMVILILAGNTAFPIFLRAEIFFLSKIVPRTSRLHETLQFLLDHPRRCFIYLFPSHQTWFLLIVVVALNVTDWLSFMVLDIGTPAIDAIPVGVRLIIGVLQAVAVRAAGFGTVTLSALAPAVKVLYVIMMYISVYPIAMSVRSTNVYEEQSLGVYRESMITDEDPDFQLSGPRMTVWSKYLAMHARKQLSFDMWWLGLALFLVCIIERPNLDDTSKATWFNIFNIVFELTSAYGTVGLSLGIPTANYSFSGAFRPLSKLIVCLVMLRGRHRGLPVAIDRAVMLPSEYQRHDEISAETTGQYINRSSRVFSEEFTNNPDEINEDQP
ncbi:hypothetical protein LENED_002124 [Lentinula edodes]|uniref:Potassium transport protein n=1 Tax=Lentinula edodes TaxID=5353 RepID=A0A1Q3E028_LENED|nr:hypothetical protein LENED_002124 [Lentinula edodes]